MGLVSHKREMWTQAWTEEAGTNTQGEDGIYKPRKGAWGGASLTALRKSQPSLSTP